MSKNVVRDLAVVAVALAGLALTALPAQAETVDIAVPKDVLARAMSSALGTTQIHLDNFGSRHGTSWHDDGSYIDLPDGSRETFHIPEYTFKRSNSRKYRYYVDDLNAKSIEAQASDSGIHLVVRFESQGEEIHGKCLRRFWFFGWWPWRECTWPIDRDAHLDNSQISVLFTPVAYDGSVSFSDPEMSFDTEIKFSTEICDWKLAEGICSHIEEKVESSLTPQVEKEVRSRLNRRSVKASIAAAVREALVTRGLIEPSWRVVKLVSSGSDFLITIERPDRIDGDSVRGLYLTPVQARVTGECPTTVQLLATIETKDKVHGTGFLRYENGQRSPDFSWAAGKGQSVTSAVSRTFDAAPGTTQEGWAQMTVEWQGTDGKSYSKTSNRAEFTVTCTPALGDRFTSGFVTLFAPTSFSAADELDDREALGLRLGGRASRHFSLELGASFQSASSSFSSDLLNDSALESDVITLDLYAIFHAPISDRLRWGVLFGPGWRFLDSGSLRAGSDAIGQATETSTFAPSVGLGLKWQLSRRWFLDSRVIQRWLKGRDEDPWVTEAQFGIGIHLGE